LLFALVQIGLISQEFTTLMRWLAIFIVKLIYSLKLKPHIFIKELELYIAYLQKDVQLQLAHLTEKKIRYFEKFKAQLLSGIAYYKQLITGQSFNEHSEIADSTPGSTWPDGFQLSLDMLIGYQLQVQSILII